MIGYGWGNACYIVNFTPGEYLLYSKVSGGKVYYIANIPRGNVLNIPGEGLLYDTGSYRQYTYTPILYILPVAGQTLFYSFFSESLVSVFFEISDLFAS